MNQPVRLFVSVLAGAVCYYVATRIAWVLCFPDTKVSLFFPPHGILVSILLLVPVRQWWAYTLAALSAHFIATQQVQWPTSFALQAEAYDGVTAVLTAAGIRHFIKSPFHLISLREALIFVGLAVFLVQFGTAFWAAAFTVGYGFGTNYWVEWRNLSVSNAVTTIVLVPVILIGAHFFKQGLRITKWQALEACLLAAGVLAVGWLVFDRLPAGPGTSPVLLYAPIPFLIWAALRFGLGGMSTSILVITMMAIWGTMHGRGPFLTQTPAENALALQLLILMVATPLMLLAIAIGEERRSKKALQVSEERMGMTAQSAQLALWDWDVANDRVWVRDQGLFGFDPNAPVDHSTLAGSVHPDDRAARSKAIESALEAGGIYEAEFRIILADGSVRWIAARGRRPSSGADAAHPRILGIAIDITRQKQAADDLQLQREGLAHLSRVATLNTLSSSLAHELSQPLSSILINAQAAQLSMAKNPPDLAELHDILADIVAADSRASEIIDRMRIMMRRRTIALQPVDVHESVEELLRLMHSDLIARGVSVENLTTVDLPRALTDRVQLQQVLLNLIVNACDAMQANEPGDRSLTLTAVDEQDKLHIRVLDNGVGLPDEIEVIFQPFHSTKAGGLGMGLSICRALVTAHGGRLWAERRAGRGAAFHLTLPLAKAPGQSQSTPSIDPIDNSH